MKTRIPIVRAITARLRMVARRPTTRRPVGIRGAYSPPRCGSTPRGWLRTRGPRSLTRRRETRRSPNRGSPNQRGRRRKADADRQGQGRPRPWIDATSGVARNMFDPCGSGGEGSLMRRASAPWSQAPSAVMSGAWALARSGPYFLQPDSDTVTFSYYHRKSLFRAVVLHAGHKV